LLGQDERAANAARPVSAGAVPRGALFVAARELSCGNLLISVKDARPSAPHMSSGSRANQAKPEALVILFRANTFKPLLSG